MSSTKVNFLLGCITLSILHDVKALIVPVLRSFDQSETSKETSRFAHTFKDHLIVPHLLPSIPEEVCSVIYDPNLIIITGQQYYSYQIEGVPEVTWDFKSDKYYTLILRGAFQKEVQYPSTTAPVLRNLSSTLTPPENWWHQWIIVDIRRNELEAGNVIQPYLRSTIAEPNSTHRVIYAFAVYEQPKKLDFGLNDGKNSPESLLQRYFNPISSFEKSSNNSALVAGNFFQVVHKPKGLVLDTSIVRILKTGFFR